jgi:SAM-dependent methyltransferase
MDNTEHWQTVYRTKDSQQVSWYREHLDLSLELLKHAGLSPDSRVIDIGGGASTLVDDLLELRVRRIAVLDISAASLDIAKRRLEGRADRVQWLTGDAVRYSFVPDSVDVWHDRAVLHFLTDPSESAAYVENARRALASGGYAVIGCFADDGPEKCSGLPVVRRNAEQIAALCGTAFTLEERRRERHVTPSGAVQSFAYALLRKH